MRIGMIVAIRREIDALLCSCGTPAGIDETPAYTIYKYTIGANELFVAESGAGELSAAATTQYLISVYGAEMIVNFGVCGGLTDDMGLCSTVVVEKAVHYDFDTSAYDHCLPCQYPGYDTIYIPVQEKILAAARKAVPEVRFVTCASADKFVEGREAKSRLHQLYAAEICEMEAAGILLTADRNHVPALLVKGVSDGVAGGAMQFDEMVHEAAGVCLKVLLAILNTL